MHDENRKKKLKKFNMKTSILCILFCSLLFCLGTSGCKNTANGAGKDIENMGEKIQEKTN